MKKYLIPLASLVLLAAACKNETVQQQSMEAPVVEEVAPVKEIHTELYGNYVGMFVDADEENRQEYIEPAKINISISQITEKGVSARSIVKGNDRPMSGNVTVNGTEYRFEMEEPGNDPHDGKFSFVIQGDSLVGTWACYDQMVKSPNKTFVLKKQPFVYTPNRMLPEDWEYVDWENAKRKSELYTHEDGKVDTMVNEYYRAASESVYTLNASKNKLKESDLKNLKKLDLEIIRNTIFARHGYSFKKKSVRQFFDQVDWYVPMNNNVDAELTQLEKDNIVLLQKFEKYAEDNYDTFGR
ncbi:MAG: YARHG domain-containing protein [Taibaiella sp.]|nr:YARHG domain-containing protein [Taibaiella sp.]